MEREEFCKIPIHVFDLPNLQEIEINHNYCDIPIDIPEKIGRLKSLRKIEIWNNQLKSIPKELEELPVLEEIILRNVTKNIKHIPDLIEDL